MSIVMKSMTRCKVVLKSGEKREWRE